MLAKANLSRGWFRPRGCQLADAAEAFPCEPDHVLRVCGFAVLEKSEFKDESQYFRFHADEEMEGTSCKNKQLRNDFKLVENILAKRLLVGAELKGCILRPGRSRSLGAGRPSDYGSRSWAQLGAPEYGASRWWLATLPGPRLLPSL